MISPDVTPPDPPTGISRRPRVGLSGSPVRRLPLLLAAAAVLALGWLVTPAPVPIYDGLDAPDEPYRYVVAPPGYRATPPVTDARTAIAVDAGRSCCELEARSGEQGPQVSVYVPRGGLAVPGAGPLSVRAEPVAPPPGPAPEEGARFEGNVYRVTAGGAAGPASLTPEGSRATIQLRALTADTPGPGVWYRAADGQPWRELATGKTGFDIFEAQFVGAGDYVLVRPDDGGSTTAGLLLAILAVPAVLVVILVVLRLRAGPMPDEDPDEDPDEVGDPDEGYSGGSRPGGSQPGGSGPGGSDGSAPGSAPQSTRR